MTAAARRGRAGGQGFLGLSAALHLLALGAVLWWAGRVPAPGPAEVPVSLVWNNAAEGAGDGSAGGSASPLPPVAPTAAAASAPPQPAAAPAEPAPSAAAPPAPAPPMAEPAPAPSSAEAPPPPPVAPEPERIALPLPPPPAPPRPQERPAERPAEASTPQAASPPTPPPPAPTTWQPPARPGVAEGLAALSGGGGLAAGAVVPARPAAGAANASPEYPRESRMRGEQGRVTLLVQVDAAGRVRDVAVVGSSGHAALDEEALRTVRGWHFEPATQDGRAVFSAVTVGITFRLEGDRRW